MFPLVRNALLPSVMTATEYFGCADLAYNAARSLAIKIGSENPKFFSKLYAAREWVAVSETVSFVASGLFAAMEAEEKYEVFSKMGRGFSYLPSAVLGQIGAYVPVTFFAAVLTAGYFAISFINDYTKPDLGLTPNESRYIEINRPSLEVYEQVVYLAKLTMTLALVFFAPSSPMFVANAALELYSLAKITQRKWIQFKYEQAVDIKGHSVPGFMQTVGNRLRFTYNFLIQDAPKDAPKGGEECPVCRDENLEVFVCNQHAYHLKCYVAWVNEKLRKVFEGLRAVKRTPVETRHHTDGRYTHSTFSAHWELSLPAGNKVPCMLCTVGLPHNTYEIEANDSEFGWVSTRVTWLTDADIETARRRDILRREIFERIAALPAVEVPADPIAMQIAQNRLREAGFKADIVVRDLEQGLETLAGIIGMPPDAFDLGAVGAVRVQANAMLARVATRQVVDLLASQITERRLKVLNGIAAALISNVQGVAGDQFLATAGRLLQALGFDLEATANQVLPREVFIAWLRTQNPGAPLDVIEREVDRCLLSGGGRKVQNLIALAIQGVPDSDEDSSDEDSSDEDEGPLAAPGGAQSPVAPALGEDALAAGAPEEVGQDAPVGLAAAPNGDEH